jgi:preprotein translocase subunit SecA
MAIYSKRNKILEQDNLHEEIMELIDSQVNDFIESVVDEDRLEKLYEPEVVIEKINAFINEEIYNEESFAKIYSKDELKGELIEKIKTKIEAIKNSIDEANFYDFEKRLYLQSIDELWMRHIDEMSHLREEVAFE